MYVGLSCHKHQPTFTYDQLLEYYESDDECKIENLKKCIEELYSLGVLGNSTRQVNKKKPMIEFSYRDNLESKANFSARFTVHYGLRNYLSM